MAGNVLLNLIENINTWEKLEKRIAELLSEQQRGRAFEEFCHAFFILDPVFQFKNVYRQNEIPHSIRERLGYPGIQDIGIDGVGITDDGRIFAHPFSRVFLTRLLIIQVCRTDERTIIKYSN